MKKILFATLATAFLLLPTACSDDFDEPAGTPQAGDDVCFTVTDINTAPDGKHNTKFGDKTGTQFPIHWQQNDMVRIACSQAHGDKEAIYRVTQNENSNLTSNVEPYQGSVKWEKNGTHYFYGGYPANLVHFDEVVKAQPAVTTSAPFTAEIPTTQEVTVTETGGEYYCAPNMDYAVMVGAAQGERTSAPENLKMVFEPAFTAVEITVQPQPEEGMYKYVTFLDISINDDDAVNGFHPLAGEFQGTVAKSGTTTSLSYGSTNEAYAPKGARNIRVNLDRKVNMSGNKPLRVTVFMLPKVAEKLKVSLGAFKGDDENTIYYTYKNITTAVAARKYNHISMGAMPSYADLKEAGDGLWQAPLDNDVHVSLLTIPGVHDLASFGYHTSPCDMAQAYVTDIAADGSVPTDKNQGASKNETNAYTLQTEHYLNTGNRAFEFKLSYLQNAWSATRHTAAGASCPTFDFKKIVDAADQWLAKHSTEFLVFIFSDYEWNTGSSQYSSHIDDLIATIPSHLMVNNVEPSVEVKDVRGKIIIINESKIDNPIGMVLNGGNSIYLNDKTKLSTVTNHMKPASDNANDLFNVYSFGTEGKGRMYVQDYLTADITSNSGFTAECQNKYNLVDKAFHQAGADHDINNWYIINTAFRYHDQSIAEGKNDDSSKCGTYGTAAGIIYPKIKAHMEEIEGDETKEPNHARHGIVLFARQCGANPTTISGIKGIEKYFWDLNYKWYSAMRNHDKYYETKKVPFRMD